MRRSNQKSSNRKRPDSKAMDRQELEAVAAVRDTLAQVIADGSHSDRSHAIESIQAIDRGWEDDRRQYSLTFRLTRVYDARFHLLGSFKGNTDELPSGSSTPMQASLYAIDHLASVLLTSLAAVGVAIYPTMAAPSGELLELPRAEQDPLLDAIEQERHD